MRLSVIGLILTLTLGSFVVPLAAEAQRPVKVARIGVLGLGPSSSEAQRQQSPFWQKLRELGWHEGQNLVIEQRSAEWQRDRLPALAADLVRLKPDLIYALGTPAGLAAKQATATIPIVLFGAGLPVETGLVHSLAQPGGNVTGVAIQTGPEEMGKRLQLLKEAAPGILQVGIFWDPDFPLSTSFRQQVQAEAEALGLTPQFLEVPASMEQLVATITQQRPDALYLIGDTFTTSHEREIAELAATHRLPSISYRPTYARAGGLMSYGANRVHLAWRAATLVDKILKGANPTDLPVERPTKLDLVINLTTAKALGIMIPPSLLLLADEVIR